MNADGGAARHGNAVADDGTGHCDAQCPHDLKWINREANVEDWVPSENDENAETGRYGIFCTEIDLWEALKRDGVVLVMSLWDDHHVNIPADFTSLMSSMARLAQLSE